MVALGRIPAVVAVVLAPAFAMAIMMFGASNVDAATSPSAGATTAMGKALYDTHCAPCHGSEGRGDGTASQLLLPRPRDFSSGHFRIRSTPVGTPPADDDLLDVVTRGIPGSSMPGFAFLTLAERNMVVAYVKTLTPLFAEASAPQPFDTRMPPKATQEGLEAGKALYTQLRCDGCHGDEGLGDGIIADGLFDDLHLPDPPRNLTTGVYKGGAAPRDVYLRITAGMEGTAMPAFGDDKASALQRWQLAYYVVSLIQKSAAAADAPQGTLVAGRVHGRLPDMDPEAAGWQAARAVRVPLFFLWNQAGAVPPGLSVRALHDGSTIAFLLEWDDPSKNDRLLLTEDFRDGAAIEFLAGGAAFVGMGDAQTPVDLWHWKADWQRDLERDGGQALPTISDNYPIPHVTGREAGNPVTPPHRASAVEEARARGHSTLTSAPLASQQAMGRGVWKAGRWHVVIARKLPKGVRGAGASKLAFAVWDGEKRDRGGQKAISAWYTLDLGGR